MAFATKYYCSFKDMYNRAVVINFQYDEWSSGSTLLECAGASIEWQSSELLSTVRGAALSVNIFQSSYNQLDEFFDINQKECRVQLTISGSTYWYGWVLSGDYSRKYQPSPNLVTVTCVDGLGLLRSEPYWNDGTIYTGRTDAFTIISRCLAKTGLTLGYKEAVNVYEDGMASTVADSPLKQTYLNQDMYFDYSTLEPVSCYEVLNRVLTIFSATVFQEDNVWWIVRIPELIDDVTVRTYNTSGTYQSNTSSTLSKAISSNDASASDYFRFINSDATLQANYVLSKMNETRHWGNQLIIDNGFEYASAATDYWTAGGGATISFSTLNNNKKAFNVLGGSANFYGGYDQSFGTSTAISGGRFYASYSMRINDTSAGSYSTAGLQVVLVGASTYYLATDGSWTTTFLSSHGSYTNNEWNNIEIISDPLPSGSYAVYIRLYSSATADDVDYDDLDVRYINTVDENEEYYSTSFEINPDNVYAQASSLDLYHSDRGSVTGVMWKCSLQLTGEAEAVDWKVGESQTKNLRSLMEDVIKAYYYLPARMIQGSLHGQTSYRNCISDDSKLYFPTRASYNLARSDWSGEWAQLPFPRYSDDLFSSYTNVSYTSVSASGNQVDILKVGTGSVAECTINLDPSHTIEAGVKYRFNVTLTDLGGTTDPPIIYIGYTPQTLSYGDNEFELTTGNTDDAKIYSIAASECNARLVITVGVVYGL